MKQISIIGAGNWGTALAVALARTGRPVRLWGFEREVVESIRLRRENELYMPGVTVPPSVMATGDLGEALAGVEIVLTVMPSHICRGLFRQMLPHLRPEMVFVSATKGIETESLMRMSEVIGAVVRDRFEPHLSVLSGRALRAKWRGATRRPWSLRRSTGTWPAWFSGNFPQRRCGCTPHRM